MPSPRLERRRETSAAQDRANRLLFIGVVAAFAIAIAVVQVRHWIDSGPVDLNRAPAATLETLPGIGPGTARAIIEARPFAAVEDLEKVKGIGPVTLEKLRPRVTVGE